MHDLRLCIVLRNGYPRNFNEHVDPTYHFQTAAPTLQLDLIFNPIRLQYAVQFWGEKYLEATRRCQLLRSPQNPDVQHCLTVRTSHVH